MAFISSRPSAVRNVSTLGNFFPVDNRYSMIEPQSRDSPASWPRRAARDIPQHDVSLADLVRDLYAFGNDVSPACHDDLLSRCCGHWSAMWWCPDDAARAICIRRRGSAPRELQFW